LNGEIIVKTLLELANQIKNPVINIYKMLEEISAEERFLGKTYQEAFVIFSGDETWICEDLLWMAYPGFMYYFCAFLNALEKSLSGLADEVLADRIAQLLMILEFRGRGFTEVSSDHNNAVKRVVESAERAMMKSDDADAARLLIRSRKILKNWPSSLGRAYTDESRFGAG